MTTSHTYSLREEGLGLLWPWWHMTTHSPRSQLTLRPHSPAFRQHVGSSATNPQLGSQVHRQNLKCPQVAISWNHNWAQRNASEQKTLVHRRELGGGVQGSPAEHHRTPVRASKQQAQRSGGNLGSPRDLSTQRKTEIKVCLLIPPVLWSNCC